MPMGPAAGGFVYFSAAKFLGYSAFAHLLRKKFSDGGKGPKRTFAIGGIRTLIGISIGIPYGFVVGVAIEAIKAEWLGYFLFFGGLVPVRLCEWYWLLRIAFNQKVRGHPWTPRSLVLGVLISFSLDAIGIAAAFVLPGGMWVC